MSTWKKFLIAILGLVIFFGTFIFIKKKQFAPPPPFEFPPEAITSATVVEEQWEQKVSAVANIRAVNGVQVSTEIPGILTQIHFKSGQWVEKGAPLIELDTSTEKADLEAALARAELSDINLTRARELLSSKTIARSEYDASVAEAKAAKAEVEALEALISKKQIHAPFTGRLGIRLVNIGEYLNPGTPIVSLQNLDKVYVNFNTPQKELSIIQKGQTVRVYSDAWKDEVFEGKISVVEPRIETNTRSLQILGTVPNPQEKLKPGMFVSVDVIMDNPKTVLSVPSTAIYYRSFGNIIFVVKEDPSKTGRKIVEERFVKLGSSRGDYISIIQGVEAGEEVATAGIFKLSNGRPVVINNEMALPYSKDPQPENK